MCVDDRSMLKNINEVSLKQNFAGVGGRCGGWGGVLPRHRSSFPSNTTAYSHISIVDLPGISCKKKLIFVRSTY